MRVASAALVFESDRSTLARACEKIDTWIAEANSETTALSGPSARASAESHGPTLLVVDDEPDIGLMALDILEPAGYIVLHTSNPFEAIWLTRQWPGAIDLSLVDVVMTIMDGRELARRLLILRPQMKVLLMSGYKDSSLAETGWAVIEKPFGIQALTQKVAETLEAGGGRPRW